MAPEPAPPSRYHRRVTFVCVPIMVEAIDAALADARQAKARGADLIEWRIDPYFHGSTGSDAEDGAVVRELQRLLAESPLPAILTCRPAWEGGEYDGDDSDRISLFEKLCTGPHAPAYLDVELAAYARSANLRQKVNLCVQHPAQQREVRTKLILSMHDFEGRPKDLDRRLLDAYAHEACAVVKVAYRARSLRDNLDLFDLTRTAPKPTIALGMGEFGLMSRVLAPKFGGFLTFASLRDASATAPGQPTIEDLLGLYRFRSIGRETKVYGVIGWPVGHSLSPHVHNAGFEAVGWDGVYVPMPVAADADDAEASYTSFKATVRAIAADPTLGFAGASVTIPHKVHLLRLIEDLAESERLDMLTADPDGLRRTIGAANTFFGVTHDPRGGEFDFTITNTDASAIRSLVEEAISPRSLHDARVRVVGAGGAARAAVYALASRGVTIELQSRSFIKALNLYSDLDERLAGVPQKGTIYVQELGTLPNPACDIYINCTPVGMAGGPDPDGLSIPIPDMPNIGPDTVFFDTVYNPVETPMLKAAKARGCRTIDGVEMFVRQAAAQFELWTGHPAPVQLFDRICRERLASKEPRA